MNNKYYLQAVAACRVFVIFTFLIIISSIYSHLQAQQVSTGYSFSTSNIAPYIPITGGHVIGTSNDDDSYYLDSIGFSFNYNGSVYTAMYIDANGYLVLGYTSPIDSYFGGHPIGRNKRCIAAFTNDLQGKNLSTSAMRIQTIGAAPFRTCVVQFSDWSLYPSPDTSTYNDFYNFQFRLNENNGYGTVQIVYGHMSATSTSLAPFGTISSTLGAQVGLSGDTLADFNDRTGSLWSTTTAGVTNTASVTTYSGNLPDSGRSFLWTPVCAISYDTISTTTPNACSGNTSMIISGASPTSNYLTYTYEWISSITGLPGSYSSALGSNTSQDYYPIYITNDTWFKRVATYGTSCADTTTALKVTVINSNTWNGSVSNAWANPSNWGCGRVPLSTDSVVIPSGVASMPVIIDGGRIVNSITILSGASLTLNNAASALIVLGKFTLNGTITNSNGSVTFAGSNLQVIPAATYNNLIFNNAYGFTTSGNIIINGALTFTSGSVSIGNYNLTLFGTTSSMSGYNSSKYVITNGTGTLNIQNIGATGRTGVVTFPIGNNNTSYNPITILNAGTSDEFKSRIVAGVSTNYNASGTPTGSAVSAFVVNKTWVMNETVAGGSSATITVQWNTSDELTGFTRASSYTPYFALTWNNISSTSAASGTNPYTKSMTGVSILSEFTVACCGALPVDLISFTGSNNGKNVELNWTTANEINNDHFELQRSVDGSLFIVIGNIKGNGSSNSVNNYQFIDNNLSTVNSELTTIYYRLNQIDFNGTANESKMISVNISKTISDIIVEVNPNPFNSLLKVNVSSFKAEQVNLVLTDITGKVLIDEMLDVTESAKDFTIDKTDHLTPGVYMIMLHSSSGTLVKKVIRSN
ncbi:MAG: T9SS type A sorting domain-containing protein [Bacteroidota bacterium]